MKDIRIRRKYRLLFLILFLILTFTFSAIWLQNGIVEIYEVQNVLNNTASSRDGSIASNGSRLKIFCMILTSPNPNLKKLDATYSTWLTECDKYVFIAKLNGTVNEIDNLTRTYEFVQSADLAKDSYEFLACKMYRALRDVYKLEPNYDWYIKADDDTYVFMDHLREFLATQNRSEPITFGYNLKPHVNKGYHSGGAGYVISNEALTRLGSKLVENISFCDVCFHEDVNVARCLRRLDVYPGNSTDVDDRERFHLFDMDAHFIGWIPKWLYEIAQNPVKKGTRGISETSISFHYIKPDIMKRLHTAWHRYLNAKKSGLTKMKFTEMLYDFMN